MSIVSNNNVKEFDRFFRLIRGGSHLETDRGDTFVTTDYSLQLSVGIKNFYQSLPEDFGLKLFGAVAPDAVGEAPKKRRLPDVSR